jgi:hypothetical protein
MLWTKEIRYLGFSGRQREIGFGEFLLVRTTSFVFLKVSRPSSDVPFADIAVTCVIILRHKQARDVLLIPTHHFGIDGGA